MTDAPNVPDTPATECVTLLAGSTSSAPITDVGGGDCIPLVREITVGYMNGTLSNATLSVSCGGATVTPSSVTVGPGPGSRTFTLTHTSAGMGHTSHSEASSRSWRSPGCGRANSNGSAPRTST